MNNINETLIFEVWQLSPIPTVGVAAAVADFREWVSKVGEKAQSITTFLT